MESGTIPLSSIPGPFDLQATLESGQTFLWTRADERTYLDPAPREGTDWYRTALDDQVVAVRQTGDALEWRATERDPTEALRDRLRLDDEMAQMLASLPDDPLIDAATAAFPGLRVVDEPFFPTLVSFILSAQMRVERIHSLVQSLGETYGQPLSFGEETVYAFPTPEELAAATERELRDLGLGYRAPYVLESAAMVADGTLSADDIRSLPYEEARTRATEFVGVGEKVADCVLLFSLGFTDPVPLDTWIRSAIEEYVPDIEVTTYRDTSRAIRERFGPYPGIAQTYVFHYLRHREALTAAGRAQQ